MLPALWGGKTWHFLHLLVSHPKRSSYSRYQELFLTLPYLLPCKKCRNNYIEHLKILPIPEKVEDLQLWLVRMHNRVNKSIDKPIENEAVMLSYWDAKHKSVYSIADTHMIEAIEYMIHSHAGFYKISMEEAKAHLVLWDIVLCLLPPRLEGYQKLREYVEKNPLSLGLVSHKKNYMEWFYGLKSIMGVKHRISTRDCNVCKIGGC